jgi:arylsulfatase A-like enzyme
MADHRFYQTYLQLGLDSTEAKYASMVESMDKSLGDLMDFLEKKNISKNTIILFMSDNGGLSAVARGGSRHMHNQPLKSGKGSIYEGGIREPMLVKWPGVTTPNSVNENYMIIEDLYPTLVEMAGIKKIKSVQKIDGVSLLSTLTNPKKLEQDRSLFWHYPNSWGPTGPGIAAFSAIRKGDWKLIYYHADEKYELFNIGQDIGETNNLILEEPEIKSKLAYELGQYLISVDAQMPFHKSTGLQTKFPGT